MKGKNEKMKTYEIRKYLAYSSIFKDIYDK